jgi:AcrR family transcriptional regulator
MANLKQQQSEQTRQHIVEAATDLFARKGFHATSVADVASAIKLTKGAFYHHFATKEDLFHAVVLEVRSVWEENVEAPVLQHEDALDRLTALLVNHARLIHRRPELCLVVSGLSEEMRHTHPDLADVLHGIYRDLIAFIEGTLRAGQGRGEVRGDIEPRAIAVDVVGMLRGVSCFAVLTDMGLECENTLGAIGPVLIAGLRPQESFREEPVRPAREGVPE